LNVCTIIAKNYVAHARVLARSLAETHPGSRLWTLLIDDFSPHIDPAVEPFSILTPSDVGCEEFTQMALRYSVLELSTAVKPWLLRHLMRETGGPVTYLDPDIKIYGTLEPLDELADRHGVVLIPHNSKPIPQDGRRPSQVDVMIAGIYNLGYVSLAPRPEVERLLDWWADRLLRDCRVDPVWGYFVDQRWFDLAPGFLEDLAIVREPEYNLAYWNLHERRLEHDGARYLVDGRPLSFFHFSGFDPEHPLVLSRHQDRIDVLADPVLERLLAEYAGDVMGAGYAASRHWPYVFGTLGDGTRLDDTLRAMFDEFADEHDGAVASPFTLEGVRSFDSWLRAQAPNAPPGISRALARVYERRTDIRGAFPDLAGDDRAAFLAWAASHGVAEEPLLARGSIDDQDKAFAQLSTAERSQTAFTPRDDGSAPLWGAAWGANVVGTFRASLDVGEIARRLVDALDASGVRTLPVLSRIVAPDDHGSAYVAAAPGDAPFSVNVICLDPKVLPEFVNHVGSEFFAGRYSVGLWLWPVDGFPVDWRERFSLLEEVWAPSAHVAAALEPLATVPVNVIPLPVAPPALEPRTRAELGLPDEKLLFYFRFDDWDAFARKNPLAVIEAFGRAFAPGSGAGLVLDCPNMDAAPVAYAQLTEGASQHPDIEIAAVDRSAAEARSVIALCDCYVSLHRAEAFGLELAEAMWFGKPVIATGYSGNLDFMTSENGLLVDHHLVAIGPGHEPYPAEATWAEPDMEHAAALMRQVFEDRDRARALGTSAAESIRSTHSLQTAGEVLRRRLEAIRATGRARIAGDRIGAHPRALAKLPMRIRQGPLPAASGSGFAARVQLRRVILRVLKPFTSYQQSVNAEIVAALGELSRGIAEVRAETGAERADMLAAARRNQAIPEQLEAQTHGIEEIKRILTQQTDRSVYLSLSELQGRHAQIGAEGGDQPESLALTGSELRAFSQNGEDGVLAEILRRIGAPARYFIEFGVESGREGNCVYLADVAGWGGLFLEAGEQMYRELESKYAGAERVRTIRARVAAENVERLFAEANVPPEPDVLSIDVDGQDYWIWEAIESFRPRVLVIEYNSSLDPRQRLVQPDEPGHSWDGSEYYGASLGALQALGDRKGYRLVHTELSGVNAFFVRADLAGHAFPDPAEVAIRGTPNYYQRGVRHPSAKPGQRYLDLDSGKLVRNSRER
jgi:glycosyltransferase involved in cell wall biosynthesis